MMAKPMAEAAGIWVVAGSSLGKGLIKQGMITEQKQSCKTTLGTG